LKRPLRSRGSGSRISAANPLNPMAEKRISWEKSGACGPRTPPFDPKMQRKTCKNQKKYEEVLLTSLKRPLRSRGSGSRISAANPLNPIAEKRISREKSGACGPRTPPFDPKMQRKTCKNRKNMKKYSSLVCKDLFVPEGLAQGFQKQTR